jgi:hypothetical protein
MVTDLNRRLMAKVFVAFVFAEFRRLIFCSPRRPPASL